jgi:hypothetical protein
MRPDSADHGGRARSYHIRDVEAGARVQQGERLTWIEAQTAALPGAEDLARQFIELSSSSPSARDGQDPGRRQRASQPRRGQRSAWESATCAPLCARMSESVP